MNSCGSKAMADCSDIAVRAQQSTLTADDEVNDEISIPEACAFVTDAAILS